MCFKSTPKVLYGLLATLLLRNNVVGCFLLFVLCNAARPLPGPT